MGLLDELQNILTGGLGTALDIEAEKARADLLRKSLAEDNVRESRGDSGRSYQTGTIPGIFGVSGTDLSLILGGLMLAIAVAGLLLRKG